MSWRAGGQIVDIVEGGRPPRRVGMRPGVVAAVGEGWRPSGWALAAVGRCGAKADQLRLCHRDVGIVVGKYVF